MNANAALSHHVLTQIADAVIFSDCEGKIQIWNPAAETLFGFSSDAALGQSLDLIIPERLRAAHWVGFHRAVASGQTRLAGKAVITRACTAAGATIYVEMSFALVRDAHGEVLGSVAIARDATERRARERALQQRMSALEAPPAPGAPHKP